MIKTLVEPLRFLERYHRDVPAPKIHSYFDAGDMQENQVGVSYVLMDWIEGNPLKDWDSLKAKARKIIPDQLAGVMVDMLVGSPTSHDLEYCG